MNEREVTDAGLALRSARKGLEVAATGKTNMYDMDPVVEIYKTELEDLVPALSKKASELLTEKATTDRTVEDLMTLAELIGVVIDRLTISKLFMLGAPYSYSYERTRRGCVISSNQGNEEIIPYNMVADEKQGAELAQESRNNIQIRES